jgi:glycosyltransferase involved in cell wall biosynthesis
VIEDVTTPGKGVTGAEPAAGQGPPKLSVVIACLNAAGTLGAQLTALAAQPCPVPWEVLVCDNGSTDATRVVARRFAARIPSLRIIDASAVRGAGAARNQGVEHALGDWIAFCDADDEVAGDWLAAMCQALAEHRFVAGRFESHRLNGARVLRSRPLQQQGELQSSDIGARLPHAGGGNMGVHRAEFIAAGGFDPAMPWLEDTDFSWRTQLAGVPLVFRPEIVVHVRLRQTFRSMFVQGRQYGMAHAVLEQRYGQPGQMTAPGQSGRPRPASPPVPRDALRRLVIWMVDHFIGGRLAWRAGWVAGHRSRRVRSVPPARPGTLSHAGWISPTHRRPETRPWLSSAVPASSCDRRRPGRRRPA